MKYCAKLGVPALCDVEWPHSVRPSSPNSSSSSSSKLQAPSLSPRGGLTTELPLAQNFNPSTRSVPALALSSIIGVAYGTQRRVYDGGCDVAVLSVTLGTKILRLIYVSSRGFCTHPRACPSPLSAWLRDLNVTLTRYHPPRKTQHLLSSPKAEEKQPSCTHTVPFHLILSHPVSSCQVEKGK